jgi:hypothetical protein
MQWFDVDKSGLAKLLERKGKAFAIYELIQNAWDTDTKRVDVTLERLPGSPYAKLVVEDDNPQGFTNLTHAFTLFAESERKGDATKRGRFNLGEKLVLAVCRSATIETTTGTVIFNDSGRRQTKRGTNTGSVFTGEIRMSDAEIAECNDAVMRLIPPAGIETMFNGEALLHREHVADVEAKLPVEIADDEGVLRRSQRLAMIEIYEPLPDEKATIYEMGIPIVETGDRWHVNVMQKVPLNFDRDNVTPAYGALVRSIVLERMTQSLTEADANSVWARDAVEQHGDTLPEETVKRIMDLRFTEKRVAFDPTDPEANKLAVSKGYVVVHGSQMSGAEWDAAKRVGSIFAAGKVTPSPKPFSDNPNAPSLKMLDRSKWTPAMERVVAYAKALGPRLMGVGVSVDICNDFRAPFSAVYGGQRLMFNAGKLGFKWFESDFVEVSELIIHEFGHQYSMDHLSSEYHDALCRLGAKMASLALVEPTLFDILKGE